MSNVECRMSNETTTNRRRPPSGIRHSTIDIRHSRRGFSLVELLTVIFIISLLIAILVPSLSAARNYAKKMTTAKEIDSVKVGLEMFKNENAADFPQTNGYPPSFTHPPIPSALTPEEASLGKFPFLEDKPSVTGAHWLPAMLMGVDQQGYIKRSAVPNVGDLRREPFNWYTPNALEPGKGITDRAPLYLDPSFPTKKTRDLPGRANRDLFPDWGNESDPRTMSYLPVIVDAFEQPILYYAANTHGKPTNMVADVHDPNNNYTGGIQQEGPPFYFHQDNAGFTGTETVLGWDFGNSGAKHPVAVSGAAFGRTELTMDENRQTFARYVVDRKIYASLPAARSPDVPLRPVNSESYLLISAGVDGRYGTNDDVSNLPPWTD